MTKPRFTPPNTITRISPKLNGQKRIELTPDLKEMFKTKFKLLAIRIRSEEIHSIKSNPITRSAILATKGLTSIRPDTTSQDGSHKLLLLNSSHTDDLPKEALEHFTRSSYQYQNYDLELDYNYFTAQEIIESLLPEELIKDAPSSFTIIGHIAHFNLREEYLPYRYLIGQIILEKNLMIKTVVNKLDSIHSEFRFFDIDLMAGTPDYQVSISQSNCRFEFDFSKVYYNPRLSTEHSHLITNYLNPHEVLLDPFSGIGPFAIRAIKLRQAFAIPSDLNPDAVQSLEKNVRLNKIDPGSIRVGLGDARVRIREGVRELWERPFVVGPTPSRVARPRRKVKDLSSNEDRTNQELLQPQPNPTPTPIRRRLVNHFVMNLPELTISFLDSFKGLYTPFLERQDRDEFLETVFNKIDRKVRVPMVHAYCFSKAEEGKEAEEDICKRASESIGYQIGKESVKRYECVMVRKVAPHKSMYRLSFEVPIEVLFYGKEDMVSSFKNDDEDLTKIDDLKIT